jgi:hypothetical protein
MDLLKIIPVLAGLVQQGDNMNKSISITFPDNKMIDFFTFQSNFSVGQKISLDGEISYEIADIEYECRETDMGLHHIYTNLILKEFSKSNLIQNEYLRRMNIKQPSIESR